MNIAALEQFALEQLEATANHDERYSFLFRTPGAISFTCCCYSVTEDWEFDGDTEGRELPWDQARIDTLQNSDAELTPEELRQWRRATCHSLAAAFSDWSSPAYVVPLRLGSDIEGYALFLCKDQDPWAQPLLVGVYMTAEAAVEALRGKSAVA